MSTLDENMRVLCFISASYYTKGVINWEPGEGELTKLEDSQKQF